MYASRTKCTEVRRGVRMQKKKRKNRDSDRTCLAFDFTQRSLHRARATRVLTVCSYQRNDLTSSPFFFFFFCKRNAFLRIGMAPDLFE